MNNWHAWPSHLRPFLLALVLRRLDGAFWPLHSSLGNLAILFVLGFAVFFRSKD